MNARTALYGLLTVVAAAAAVLSFDALRALALLCGFGPRLAWLLPVVVDAGAAAGSLVWLGGHVATPARRFARVLALVLLASSVAANALGHGLAAYAARPAWWVVVAVSAVPPAVLGAVVHLAVLVGRPVGDTPPGPRFADLFEDEPLADDEEDHADEHPDGHLAEHGFSRAWDDPPPAGDLDHDGDEREGDDRAAELIAAGAGRRRLARELGLSEHQARALLASARNGKAVAR